MAAFKEQCRCSGGHKAALTDPQGLHQIHLSCELCTLWLYIREKSPTWDRSNERAMKLRTVRVLNNFLVELIMETILKKREIINMNMNLSAFSKYGNATCGVAVVSHSYCCSLTCGITHKLYCFYSSTGRKYAAKTLNVSKRFPDVIFS